MYDKEVTLIYYKDGAELSRVIKERDVASWKSALRIAGASGIKVKKGRTKKKAPVKK